MIKKIDKITDFGIFKNFNWNAVTDIDEFKEKNIFYGWNYSGKTTLSRIFSSLRDKALHPDYTNASFRISLDTGLVDSTTLSTFPYSVEVFNSDYIKDNLRWGFDENINAIFFEVGDNAKITGKIDIITGLIDVINGTDTIKGKKEPYLKVIGEYNNFEEQFTNEARSIKNDSFVSLIEFTKANLKKIKGIVLSDLDKYIIKSKDELNLLSQVVKIKEPKEKLIEVTFSSNFEEIIKLVKEVLSNTPTKSEVIEILEKKQNAYEWAKYGLTIHSKGDNCIFCGNKVDDLRYDALINYFANQTSKLKEKIKLAEGQIAKELELINSVIIPYSQNDFNENFSAEFKKLKSELEKELKKYHTILSKINSTLKQKNVESIYTKISTPYEINDQQPLLNKIKQINELIINNNKFSDDFVRIISRERDKYKNHLVANFLKKIKYLSVEKKYEKALIQIKILDKKVQDYQKEIIVLSSKKESDKEGCSQYNSFLQSFLSRNDIEIVLNNTTKKFNLMRGIEVAQNLSEGEKMAISFSHFMVYLKSVEKKGELKNLILFIDDPISSLDSNHVFQINSLLKEMLFDRIANPDPKLKDPIWILKCKQLFISTHNFEFFNLLKELPKSHGLGKKESRYFISRMIDESTIEKLPNVYNSYSSEYQYLFSEIINFDKDVHKNSNPKLLLMPNILRRFVEIYTLTKYPSNEEVDHRADIVFGKVNSKRILKPMHYFSHFNNIDRIGKQSELIADVGNACRVLIDQIENQDKMHYLALSKSL